MKLRKNRETPPGRQPQIEPRQNANIMRYYRPEHKEPMVRRVSTLKQPATKNDSAKHTFSRLSSVFIQWSIVGVIIILLIMNISLSSTTVRVKGSSYHYRSIEDYQRITDGILTKQLAYRSKITLSSERLESEIRTAIPEAEEVVAVVPLAGRQLQVILHIAEPLIRIQRQQSNMQGVISTAGIVTSEATSDVIAANFASLPIITIVGVDTTIGAQILTQSEIGLISLLLKECDGSEPFRPKVTAIEFNVQKREMNIRFESVSYYGKVTPERESRTQVGALIKTLQYLKEQGSTPTEYIDVRVDDRVFVK